MPEVLSPQCVCRIFTFKEGVLSAMAHDLEIAVTRCMVRWDAELTAVEGTFDAKSLRVVHALRDGQATALSERDQKQIEANIVAQVLLSNKYPEIQFRSSRVEPTDNGYMVTGVLRLVGVERPLTLSALRHGDRFVVRSVLHQPDFGIKPFSAMLGALKLKPDVTVELSLPAGPAP